MTYIEREALIARFKKLTLGENSLIERLFADGVYAVLETFPAADVVPVKHGRWVASDMGGGECDEAYICSVCGEPWTLFAGTPSENNMHYCPNCGAKMDLED